MFSILENINLSQDLELIIVFCLILILPKILLRFKIPSGVTALVIGIIFSVIDPSLTESELIKFLAIIGITSLFLFAGLEVDSSELKERKTYLTKYLIKFTLIITVLALILFQFIQFDIKIAFLIALGLLTPSAGFILNSLHAYDISENDESWIKSKAISKEIVSILILFLVLQFDNPILLFATIVFFSLCYIILPQIITLFFKLIQPYAPNTEISFLVALSLLMGVITKEMGTYYIIGAFMVGLIGNRFLSKVKTKKEEQDLLSSLSSFFSVFLPFYFFHVGIGIDVSMITEKVMIGSLSAFFIFTPLRMMLIHYGFFKFEDESNTEELKHYRVSLALMPTLVFGLIVAKLIIKLSPENVEIAYMLIIYTILTSILPALFSSFGKKKTIIF